MSIAADTFLGRYKIRSHLGAGGMGEVYLAHDTKLGRNVALKILPHHFASDQQRMKRFILEAKAASALNHPNIITIHEVGNVDNIQFMATEFIDGVTLRHLLSKSEMRLGEKLDIVIQVASALAAAHAAGIVHRDIKPENIMVRHDGYAKVLDFGLAKLIEPTTPASDLYGATAVTESVPGVIMGTFKYMSPEQARGLPVDARSDIWSFGVVLYEMIAGCQPFAGATASDVIAAILERTPQPLTQRSPEAPAELERIVSKTLAKEREERYQSVKDLLVDLRQLERRLKVDVELERHAMSEQRSSEAVALDENQAALKELPPPYAERPGETKAVRVMSSAEYLVSEVKHHKRGAVIALAALLMVVAGLSYFYVIRNNRTAIRSMAVLPFINSSVDQDNDYLSDTIAESLINSLSQIPNLRVVARSIAFNYKERETDPRKIGRELDVDAIVTGKFTKRGDTLSLQVDLVDVAEGTQLWGAQYDRRLEDIPVVKEEIFRDISKKLRSKVADEEQNAPPPEATPFNGTDRPTRGQVPES